jgi:hypothetical protein
MQACRSTLVTIALLTAALMPVQAQDEAPSLEELTQLAFPKWSDDSEGRVRQIALTSVTQAWRTDAPPQRLRAGQQRKVEVEPARVVRLAQNRFALIVKLRPLAADNASEVGRGTPVGLAAYVFQTSATGWKLSRRQEPFDLQGLDGQLQIDEVELSQQRRGLVAEYDSCWQGRCAAYLVLYELGKDGVQPKPLLQQALHGDNLYARPDCVARLRPVLPERSLVEPDHADQPVAPGRCYAIKGSWRIAPSAATPGTLTLQFSGGVSEAAGTPAERVERSMRFDYRAGKYQAVDGRNPIPSV